MILPIKIYQIGDDNILLLKSSIFVYKCVDLVHRVSLETS